MSLSTFFVVSVQKQKSEIHVSYQQK